MNIVMDKLLEYCGQWKQSSKGWISFNGKCCIHNGDSRNDTKGRTGMHISDDGFVYHCFNCGFKTGWKQGANIGTKITNLLEWYSVPDDEIKQIKFKAYQYKLQKQNSINDIVPDDETKNKNVFLNFDEIKFPDNFYNLDYCMNKFYNNKDFIKVADYILSRGDYIAENSDFYWSPSKKNSLIIPCKWNNKKVGWIERSILKNSKIRYINKFPTDYLFNYDQGSKGDVLFVCEGPFDALSVNGIATIGDKLSDKQIQWLNQLKKEIVIIPDRENNGGKLVDIAISNKWSAAVPDWDDDIKDCNDALKKYGVLFTTYSLMDSICDYSKLRTKRFKLKRRI